MDIPQNYKLGELYEYASGRLLGDNVHQATHAVSATSAVLRFPFVWEHRLHVIAALHNEQQGTNEISQVVANVVADTTNKLNMYLEDYYSVEIMNLEYDNLEESNNEEESTQEGQAHAYVDRFYTSLDLLKALDEMSLYVTGTVMKNRLPKELTITKSSKEIKNMMCGDYKKHGYSYTMANGIRKSYGLACWKDRDIVYCLSNRISTNEQGICYWRSANRIICNNRPKVIETYNSFMGGVDLANMQRLHCNSTIMGQNRWWLKLFFYILDAGTSNALILFKEAMEGKNKDMTIVEFKSKLVESLMGTKIGRIDQPMKMVHKSQRTDSRFLCAYCAFFGENKRTTF
jgi:Transposase IS4